MNEIMRFDDLGAELDERTRAMYVQRILGWKLQEIGDAHGVTRERVRQCLLKADKLIVRAADAADSSWREALSNISATSLVSTASLATLLNVEASVAIDALARHAGFSAPRAWGQIPVAGWWSRGSYALDNILRQIVEQAPLQPGELAVLFAETVPGEFPIEDLLNHRRSLLVRGDDGSWLRRSARGRDAAYLWMTKHGTPCRVEELAKVMGVEKVQAAREAFRRDDRFAQIRPEGTWVLIEWSHPGVSPYHSAEEAMIAVLEQEGAMTRERLFARVAERYPVSTWRLQQCLFSDRIGVTSEGLVDLIVHGAQPIDEPEPAQPATMAVDDLRNVFGIQITVDKDLLRGSGLAVSTWLTWQLGLRRAPMARTFAVSDSANTLTIRRSTSGAQVSSIRQYVQAVGAVAGCHVIVLLRTDDSTARVVHRCPDGVCPAIYAVDS